MSKIPKPPKKKLEQPLENLPKSLCDDKASGLGESQKLKFLVGVGASAGGLDSLEKLFRNMPDRSGLAFVVIQHLSPDYKSMMVELLSKYTNMAIRQAEDGMQVERDTVYLIPPKGSLKVSDGKLCLSRRSGQTHVLHLPIDIFFRSLAEDMEQRAIGIILSGTGSDGTLGSRAIKEAGGMLMVQDPASAQFDGMPNSAIHTGVADYVLPPDKMPSMLLKYVKHPMLTLEKQVPTSSKNEDILASILDVIREETGLDFSYYKPSTIIRRIERRMGVNQIEKLDHYQRYLEKNPSEIQVLYSELLIGVTRFLRDKEAFDLIAEKVIPEIIKTREERSRTPVRIWVAGCSSGEEVYSLAILLSEYYERHGLHPETKIFATDIDQRAVDIAAVGKYPASIVSDVPMPLLSKYFFKSDDAYQVVEKIRKMVIFARHNLLKDPPFNNLDLVTCRNLLIYLQNDMQHKVLSMFGFALKKDGFLFLGSSETVGALGDMFAVFESKWRIFRYKGGATFADFRPFEIERNHDMPRITASPHPRSLSLREPDTVMQRIQSHLLDFYLAPTLVLDQDLNLIHTIGEVNDFLQLPKGQVSFNIFKLTDSSLSGLISNAVRKARQTQQPVRYKDVILTNKENPLSLTFVVEPFFDEKSKRRFFLLTFQGAEKVATSVEPIKDLPVGDERELRLQEMEHELQLTRENLQATIEELETSNEELQATNEELMSANEELQSTNEELQSVNEELYTLNSEYQNKIEELTALNNDVDNLLNSTHIGTMFLDNAFRIRKFTPAIKEQFPIVEYDVGRPIGHFAANFDYPELMQDLEETLNTLIPRQLKVSLSNGTTYQVRILPYRTANNTIEGLVLTFVDITEQIKISEALAEKDNLYRTLIESIPHIVWLENAAGEAIYINKAWYQLTGLTETESLGQGWSKALHPDDKVTAAAIVQRARQVGEAFSGEARYWTKEGSYRYYHFLGIPVKNDKAEIVNWVGINTDLTVSKEAQQRIADSESLFRQLYEHAPIGLTLKTLDGRLLMANPALLAMLGYDEKDLQGMSYRDITPSEYQEVDRRHLQQLQKNGSYGPFFKEYQTRGGQRIPVLINGIAHTQGDGTQYVWSFIQRQQLDNPNVEDGL
jgi:two-component system CheB/CheR fusion protein